MLKFKSLVLSRAFDGLAFPKLRLENDKYFGQWVFSGRLGRLSFKVLAAMTIGDC